MKSLSCIQKLISLGLAQIPRRHVASGVEEGKRIILTFTDRRLNFEGVGPLFSENI